MKASDFIAEQDEMGGLLFPPHIVDKLIDWEMKRQSGEEEAIMIAIWKASNQAIKYDSAIAIANKARVSGVATTPREFERVVGVATKWAYCQGLDVEYCVDMFVTTAARCSRELAIGLGLVVSDRASTGLTAAERTQIFLEDMIRATGWDYARMVVTSGVEHEPE